jgi:diguanylate cyclase (GGDEF)-like protein
MTDLEKMLRGFREQFVRGSGERFSRVALRLTRLEEDPTDVEALRDLRLEFHGFCGLGGTYGFPQVTQLGLLGEKQCDALLSAGAAPGEADLGSWRLLSGKLRSQITGEPVDRAADWPSQPAAAAARPDVLLVEDDPAVSKLLTLLAERDGLAVRCAPTRGAALGEVDRRMPSLALVDEGLPDGSGFGLIEQIRSRAGGEELPILVLSGRARVLDRVEAIHCGADGLVAKPVDWRALSRQIHRLLEKPQETARILSVEDDPDQANFLRSVLETAGYEVHVIPDGGQLDAALSAFAPELVLMDILLPGVSGSDLVRGLRQDTRYATLPLVFLTTESQLDVRIEAIKAGGDDCLVKPVAPGLLLSTVAARIERARFLKDLIERDGLTGLLTQTAFLERARIAIGRLQRHPEGPILALVIVDLDNFQEVNDAYGHPAGDGVVASLAAVLKRRLRQTDTIGRLGGEEFGVLLEDLTREDAVRLLQRLVADFSAVEQGAEDGRTFHAGFSAGIAMFEPGSTDLGAWLERANRALSRAKQDGRGHVVAA